MIRIAEPLPDDDGPCEDRFEHRHFDPTVGRWLNEDAIGFAECNVPRYAGNGPINAAEPSQLGSFSDDRASGGGR